MAFILKTLSICIHPALKFTHLAFHLLRNPVDGDDEVKDEAVKKINGQTDENVFHGAKVKKSIIDNRKREALKPHFGFFYNFFPITGYLFPLF